MDKAAAGSVDSAQTVTLICQYIYWYYLGATEYVEAIIFCRMLNDNSYV